MLNFAIDFGNGFVKAMNDKRYVVAPASVAKQESLGRSNIESFVYDKTSDLNMFHSSLDYKTNYLWGKDVETVNKFRQTGRNANKYNMKHFRLLCEFVLAELASDYNQEELQENEVYLVTGMPSELIGTKQEKEFKEFLIGKHLVKRNANDILINVAKVQIIEQPLGTVFNLYMNDEGKMLETLKTDKIIILDFGAGTTIVDTFKSLRRLDKESGTHRSGINNIYTHIENSIKKGNETFSSDLTPYIKQGFEQGDYKLVIEGQENIPFKEVAKDEIEELIDDVSELFGKAVNGTDTVNRFIVTGGGLNVVKPEFEELAKVLFSEIEVTYVDEPQRSNVAGFYKLAKVLSK